MNNSNKYQRYQRQILLKELGEPGQEKLGNAKVLVIGAGGLGCPALQYLAAAGTGTIGIVDYDVVDVSNLHRQILYTVDDIGKLKAETAGKKLKLLNPEIELLIYNTQLRNYKAVEIISGYDVVIDGSDNFATRYMVNDACVLLDKPLVYGAVLRFEGQVGVFNLADKLTNSKTNYRDLFDAPPSNPLSISCNEVGVLGVIPGVIGTMQATEAIKIITGIGKPLCNTILTYNALNNQFYDFTVLPSSDLNTQAPKNIPEFLNFNYELFCETRMHPYEISVSQFDEMRSTEKITIIDVREINELPVVDEFEVIQIPVNSLKEKLPVISKKHKIALFCQSGIRSLKAAILLNEEYSGYQAFSLKGGITDWKQKQQPVL